MLGFTEISSSSTEMYRYWKHVDCGIPGCRCTRELVTPIPKCDCHECKYQSRVSTRRDSHWIYPTFSSSFSSRDENLQDCKCCSNQKTFLIRKEVSHDKIGSRYRLYDDHVLLKKENMVRQASLMHEESPRVRSEPPFSNRYLPLSIPTSLPTNIKKELPSIKLAKQKIRQKRRFQCLYCEKSFGKSSHLRDHHRTHSGERPFGCRYCGKAFSQFSNLRTHLRIHTGEKPFKCQVCEKSFTQRVTLRSHMRTHSNTGNLSKSLFDTGINNN